MKETSTEVVFLGAGPGDPELITLKGRRLLDEADLIVYAGSLVNPALLDGVRAETVDSAGLDLETIVTLMIEAARAGRRVVRLHTGDPSIYGAIREQIQRLRGAGIGCRVVPGVSSALAAAAALGVELTVPELTQTVIFTRQAGRTPVPERESLRNLAAIQASLCLFLSASLVDRAARELMAGGYPPDTPVAVVEKATWPGEERIIRGRLDTVAGQMEQARIRKTAMILVGRALADDDSAASRLYDPGFSHGCRRAGE